MSRHNAAGSYGHRVRRLPGPDLDFEVSWTVDRYYSDSRLRFPRRMSRVTDEKGAKRFAKKWKLELPK